MIVIFLKKELHWLLTQAQVYIFLPNTLQLLKFWSFPPSIVLVYCIRWISSKGRSFSSSFPFFIFHDKYSQWTVFTFSFLVSEKDILLSLLITSQHPDTFLVHKNILIWGAGISEGSLIFQNIKWGNPHTWILCQNRNAALKVDSSASYFTFQSKVFNSERKNLQSTGKTHAGSIASFPKWSSNVSVFALTHSYHAVHLSSCITIFLWNFPPLYANSVGWHCQYSTFRCHSPVYYLWFLLAEQASVIMAQWNILGCYAIQTELGLYKARVLIHTFIDHVHI